MNTPNTPAAGWYPDPTNRGGQRYWDGSAWTDQTTVTPPSPTNPALENAAAKPWWQTWWAVVPTLIVFAPLGLVGLWLRKGTANKVKWIVTAATVLLVVVILVTPHNKQSPTAQPPATEPTTTPTLLLVSVPTLDGDGRAAAEHALTAAHLLVGSVTRRQSAQPAGTVLAEDPTAGSQAAPGTKVDLVIAEPRPHVPNVVGLYKATAIARLRSAGFIAVVSRHVITYGTNGVVLSENPRGGTPAISGTRIKIVVSELVVPAPAPTTQPAAPPQSCTTTSSGTCIQGGEFCRQDEYGTYGYDANGTRYTCTGDPTHPHWE